jgi:hypothetical protein
MKRIALVGYDSEKSHAEELLLTAWLFVDMTEQLM